MTDTCPSCGARRVEITNFACYDPWHSTIKPELMFAFRVPGPEYSKTVSETELKRMVEKAKLGDYPRLPFHELMTLALAAERMIELSKIKPPPMPTPTSPKLDPTKLIRRQLAAMLEDVGLDPDRFLTNPASVHYTKEPSNVMCPGQRTVADPKQVAEQASRELAQLMNNDLGVSVTPILLRLWLVERWDQVAKLAHKIHNQRKD